MAKEVQELYYERAATGRRLSSLLLDVFCSFLLGFLLLVLVLFLLDSSSIIKAQRTIREELSLSSGLYVQEEGKTRRYLDLVLEDESAVDNQSEEMDFCLEAFYAMETFFPKNDGTAIYLQYKEEAKTEDGMSLFENGKRCLTNDDYDGDYLQFYKESYEIALGYLFQNEDYASSSKAIILIYTFSIIGDFLFAILVFFLIVPLLFGKTKQTLGMKMTHLALVSADGLALSTGRFLGRFLFLFLIEVVLSLASFLIPFFVSLGMMVLSKTHQSLHDYVLNTYCIFLDKGEIYKDEAEYRLSRKEKEGSIALEDPKYRPVSGVDQDNV